jgi:hypothetical protein
MLLSVKTRYGKNSLQYMQAGGKLRQSNKRSAVNATSAIFDLKLLVSLKSLARFVVSTLVFTTNDFTQQN